jgi:hypothetical protein
MYTSVSWTIAAHASSLQSQLTDSGEINEAGGVLTFFIPAKTFGDDD